MNKRYDLFINTQFFDDHQSQLQIPQAIKIVQNIDPAIQYEDQYSNIQQLLRNNENNSQILRATLQIQKILNNYLFSNFISGWNKIKSIYPTQIIIQSKLYKNPSESLHIEKIRTQYHNESIDSYKKSNYNASSKIHLKSSNSQYKSIHLHQIKAKDNDKSDYKNDYQRVKVLKEIMQKLKYIDHTKKQIISHNDNANKIILEDKIYRLQNIVQNYISESQSQKQRFIHHNKYANNNMNIKQGYSNKNSENSDKQSYNSHGYKSQYNNKYSTQATLQQNAVLQRDDDLYNKIGQELINIKKEMQSLKEQNGKIVELQTKRRQNLMKVTENQRYMQDQYARMKNQIILLERNKERQMNLRTQQRINMVRLQQGQKYLKNQYNHLRNQMLLIEKQKSEEIYHSKMMLMRQNQKTRLFNQNAMPNNSFYQKQPKAGGYDRSTLIPAQPNPFGYSTFTDSQKDSKDNMGYQKQPKDGNRNNESINPQDWRNRMVGPNNDEPCC